MVSKHRSRSESERRRMGLSRKQAEVGAAASYKQADIPERLQGERLRGGSWRWGSSGELSRRKPRSTVAGRSGEAARLVSQQLLSYKYTNICGLPRMLVDLLCFHLLAILELEPTGCFHVVLK